MKIKYPILESEIARRGIKKKAIYSKLRISGKSLYNKMAGISPITWVEVCEIQSAFFPDISKEHLFATEDSPPSRRAG